MNPNFISLINRFHVRTRIESKHWIWLGAVNRKTGHSLVKIDKHQYYLHRYMFCLLHKLDYRDYSFTVNHICNIPRCWSPLCLYKGTMSENMQDYVRTGKHHESNKTHCPRGHRLWFRAKSGKRVCLECNRIRDHNRKRYTKNGYRFTVPGTRKI